MDINSLEKEAVACTCFAGHGNERARSVPWGSGSPELVLVARADPSGRSFVAAKEYVDDDDVECIFS